MPQKSYGQELIDESANIADVKANGGLAERRLALERNRRNNFMLGIKSKLEGPNISSQQADY